MIKRVVLKEKSPEYADEIPVSGAANACKCDMDGCPHTGEFRAPKDRSLNTHYMFCTEHIRAYNAAWDYFSGLSAQETEQVYRNTLYGDRPTRPINRDADFLARLRTKAFEFMEFSDFTSRTADEARKQREIELSSNTPIAQALRLFELPLSASDDDIKQRYRALIKEWHPDRHGGDEHAQERVKQINMAYTILKARFEG